MAQQLDPNCSGAFVIEAEFVYFPAGGHGLYRVPCDGSAAAKQLDPNCGNLAVPGDEYVYFQSPGHGLYRVPCDGSAAAKQLDPNCGNLAVPGDGYVYFQAPAHGLYRVPCDGSAAAKQLDPNCGNLAVPGDGYVYFEAPGHGLYRVPCDGSAAAKQLDPNCGNLAVPGDGYVYFQSPGHGLYRVPCDGSAAAKQLDPNCGFLAVPGYDAYVYFQSPGHGLYRVPCDGSAAAKQLDPNCGYLTVFGDGYVYFQSPGHGLYRVKCDGSAPAQQLDANCGYLTVPGDGYIYFQGGPSSGSLYRTLIPVQFPAPAGLRIRVQDQYEVNTVLPPSIDAKYNAIKSLLDEASADSSNTWFLNFTSGASILAYPNAVAGRINDTVKSYIETLAEKKQNRLGTIIMDFPEPDYIGVVFNYNSGSPLSAQDWMAAIPDQTSLSKLTIPGTHDSCTFNASAISKCQNLALDAQLEAGIRFIDIRCRQFNDVFELHHGIEYLKLNFDYVLSTCLNFLQKHSKECIIMSVKEEHDPANNRQIFEDRFTGYIKNSRSSWYLGNTIPALSAVRGKIVLVRRFYIEPGNEPTVWGIDLANWPGNTTFTSPLNAAVS